MTDNLPLISIIVPIYNVEDYLEKCVNSLLAQTYPNCEIILVDDGSPDNCPKMCDDFAKEHENISVIHKENGGLADARNAGIEKAKGEFVAFVDSDDYVDSDMYLDMINLAIKHQADIVIGQKYIERPDSTYLRTNSEMINVMNSELALTKMNSFQTFDVSACDRIFRKSLFDDIKFPRGVKSEDFFAMFRLIDKADWIVETERPYYHYVQRPNSLTRSAQINTDYRKAAAEQLEFFKEHYPDIVYVAESALVFADAAVVSAYIRNGIALPKQTKQELQLEARVHLPSVMKNPYIPDIKKKQAFAFCYCMPVYKKVIKKHDHR